ncbi:MAG: coproporphyrinogen III oxidase, partial [Muribaculaceae bacterium]|nr:coproporphyrinogen III oxidase [Muribaculaceae bacterium]
SAHSYDGDRKRRWNVAEIKGYMEGIRINSNYYEEESLSETEMIEERIMTGLRTTAGIDLRRFKNDFGVVALDDLMNNGKDAESRGFLEISDNFMRLTDTGIMISDEIIVELF